MWGNSYISIEVRGLAITAASNTGLFIQAQGQFSQY
jgi:hypothetical protein